LKEGRILKEGRTVETEACFLKLSQKRNHEDKKPARLAAGMRMKTTKWMEERTKEGQTSVY
jgi:hypothetical protein